MKTVMLSLGVAVFCWVMVKAHSVKAPDLPLREQNEWLEKNIARLNFWGNLGYVACGVAVIRILMHVSGALPLWGE